MKKYCRVAVVILLSMLLLSSCIKKETPPEIFGLGDRYKTVGADNLYDLGIDKAIDGYFPSDVQIRGDYMLLSLSRDEFESDEYYTDEKLAVFSIQEGRIIYEKKMPYDVAVLTDKWKAVVISDDMKKISVLNTALEPIWEKTIDGYYVGCDDHDSLWYKKGAEMIRVDLNDGSETKFDFPAGYDVYSYLGSDGAKEYIMLCDNAGKMYLSCADTENGTYEVTSKMRDNVGWHDEYLIYGGVSEMLYSSPSEPDIMTVVPKEESGEYIWQMSDSFLVSGIFTRGPYEGGTFRDDIILRAYGSDGKMIDKLVSSVVPNSEGMRDYDCDESGRVVLSVETDGKTKMLIWDIGEKIGSKTQKNTVDLSDIGSVIASEAEELNKKYGVEVIYGRDGMKSFPEGYTLTAGRENISLYDAITALRSALAEYDKNYFKSLSGKGGAPVKIYLPFDIRNAEGKIVSSGAAVNNDGVHIAINGTTAIDIADILTHELTAIKNGQ